jgi:hypothetical protein
MWQCAIQVPGSVTSSRMSTVSPVRSRTVSFQTRLRSMTPSRLSIRKRPGAVYVEGVVHRVVPGPFVDEPDLDLVADPELPLDRGVHCLGV